MSTVRGSLRRNVFAPSLYSVGFSGRGFPVMPSAATRRLEMVPQSVVCGFEWGMDSRDLWELERRLDMIEPEMRGFAYEGATMALTILDASGIRRRNRTRELLLSSGEPHIFLAYIGIGFAMAKLPRALWKKVLPDLHGSPFHPTMSWLAVDGYGFDLAYFHTRRWVDEQAVPPPYPWEGAADYFPRAVDQGIGRALWFIHGAGVDQVAAAVRGFAGHRQADLWSGVGLAATFAGGCTSEDMVVLRDAAGVHRPDLALGTVFATKARDYSAFLPPHTKGAVAAFTGSTVSDVLDIADRTAVHAPGPDSTPAYELWRRRIRECFAEHAEKTSNSEESAAV